MESQVAMNPMNPAEHQPVENEEEEEEEEEEQGEEFVSSLKHRIVILAPEKKTDAAGSISLSTSSGGSTIHKTMTTTTEQQPLAAEMSRLFSEGQQKVVQLMSNAQKSTTETSTFTSSASSEQQKAQKEKESHYTEVTTDTVITFRGSSAAATSTFTPIPGMPSAIQKPVEEKNLKGTQLGAPSGAVTQIETKQTQVSQATEKGSGFLEQAKSMLSQVFGRQVELPAQEGTTQVTMESSTVTSTSGDETVRETTMKKVMRQSALLVGGFTENGMLIGGMCERVVETEDTSRNLIQLQKENLVEKQLMPQPKPEDQKAVEPHVTEGVMRQEVGVQKITLTGKTETVTTSGVTQERTHKLLKIESNLVEPKQPVSAEIIEKIATVTIPVEPAPQGQEPAENVQIPISVLSPEAETANKTVTNVVQLEKESTMLTEKAIVAPQPEGQPPEGSHQILRHEEETVHARPVVEQKTAIDEEGQRIAVEYESVQRKVDTEIPVQFVTERKEMTTTAVEQHQRVPAMVPVEKVVVEQREEQKPSEADLSSTVAQVKEALIYEDKVSTKHKEIVHVQEDGTVRREVHDERTEVKTGVDEGAKPQEPQVLVPQKATVAERPRKGGIVKSTEETSWIKKDVATAPVVTSQAPWAKRVQSRRKEITQTFLSKTETKPVERRQIVSTFTTSSQQETGQTPPRQTSLASTWMQRQQQAVQQQTQPQPQVQPQFTRRVHEFRTVEQQQQPQQRMAQLPVAEQAPTGGVTSQFISKEQVVYQTQQPYAQPRYAGQPQMMQATPAPQLQPQQRSQFISQQFVEQEQRGVQMPQPSQPKPQQGSHFMSQQFVQEDQGGARLQMQPQPQHQAATTTTTRYEQQVTEIQPQQIIFHSGYTKTVPTGQTQPMEKKQPPPIPVKRTTAPTQTFIGGQTQGGTISQMTKQSETTTTYYQSSMTKVQHPGGGQTVQYQSQIVGPFDNAEPLNRDVFPNVEEAGTRPVSGFRNMPRGRVQKNWPPK